MDALGAKLNDLTETKPAGLRLPAVPEGAELLRILRLRRRPAPSANLESAAETAAFLTERLAKSAAPYPGKLRPLQAACLSEAWQVRGLAGFLKPGAGKSCLGYLMPAVLASRAPLYVAPANMRQDMAAEFTRFAADWKGPAPAAFPFLSYEKLAAPTGGEDVDEAGNVTRLTLLERIRPDLIVFDESHALAAMGNVATKRVRAYLRKNPKTVVVALTGSPFKTSIRDAAHILEWVLGDQSPLPRPSVGWQELAAWSDFLDVHRDGPKCGVGALIHFLTPEQHAQYDACWTMESKRKIIRRAVSSHIYETPGVVSSQEGVLTDDTGRVIGLEISALLPRYEDSQIDDFFEGLRNKQLPDGTPLEDGFAVARHAETGALGYWQIWSDPRPPQWWLAARNDWVRWCSKAINNNRRGIDSAARMERAVLKGVYNDEGRLARWKDARARYTAETGFQEPPTEAVWLSDQAVQEAAEWVRVNQGLVWVRGIEIGQRLSSVLGIPYYGSGGKDASKRHIKNHPGGPAIASFQSNRVGRNLQGMFSKCLWLVPPEEQSLARTHRPGQQASVVQNVLYLGSVDALLAYERQRDLKADFAGDMTLTAQRLELADCYVPTVDDLQERPGPRWTREPPANKEST